MNRFATVLILLILLALTAVTFWMRSCSPTSAGAQLVFDMTPDKVRKITIRSTQGTFEIARQGQGWQVVGKGIADRADDKVVRSLLDAALALTYYDKIPSSEITAKNALDAYGLAAPKTGIELRGEHEKFLFFGKEAALEGRLYARFHRSSTVLIIDDSLRSFTEMSEANFLDRLLTKIKPPQVDALVIRGALGEIALKRTPQGWLITKPLTALADNEVVGKHLASLLQAPIAAFVLGKPATDLATLGIEEGKNEVLFWTDGEALPATLRLGKLDNDCIAAQYTSRSMIAFLPAEAKQLITVTPDQLRDRRIFSLNLESADRIHIETPTAKIGLERDGDIWTRQSEGDTSKHPVTPEAFNKMILALATARIIDFSTASPTEAPSHSVRFCALLRSDTPNAPTRELDLLTIKLHPTPDTPKKLLATVQDTDGLTTIGSLDSLLLEIEKL